MSRFTWLKTGRGWADRPFQSPWRTIAAYGTVSFFQDRERLLEVIFHLTNRHERSRRHALEGDAPVAAERLDAIPIQNPPRWTIHELGAYSAMWPISRCAS